MKTSENNEVKNFPLKFSKLIIALCIGIFVLCSAGIGVTIFRIVKNGGLHGFTDFLKYPFLILVCIFCVVLIAALLVKSQYTVDKTHFSTQFGFIKSKFPLKDFTSMELDRDEHKLTMYSGESYMVIKVSPDWQEDLASEILRNNPDVEYTYTLTSVGDGDKTNEKPNDNDKKDE